MAGSWQNGDFRNRVRSWCDPWIVVFSARNAPFFIGSKKEWKSEHASSTRFAVVLLNVVLVCSFFSLLFLVSLREFLLFGTLFIKILRSGREVFATLTMSVPKTREVCYSFIKCVIWIHLSRPNLLFFFQNSPKTHKKMQVSALKTNISLLD